jgi:hypothetical protein
MATVALGLVQRLPVFSAAGAFAPPLVLFDGIVELVCAEK